MAKRKTPKVDLKPRAEKITDQQLERLQKAVAGVNKAKNDIGGLEIQKHSIVGIVNELSNIITELRTEFKNDYGTDDVNIQDGSIMYSEENVKADS